MEFLSNLEREEFLADIATGSFNPKKEKKQIETEIYIDPNHQLSDDCKFGHELSKDSIAWKRYFNS